MDTLNVDITLRANDSLRPNYPTGHNNLQSSLDLVNGSFLGPMVITAAVAEGNRCSGSSLSARGIHLRRRTQVAMGMPKYAKSYGCQSDGHGPVVYRVALGERSFQWTSLALQRCTTEPVGFRAFTLIDIALVELFETSQRRGNRGYVPTWLL